MRYVFFPSLSQSPITPSVSLSTALSSAHPQFSNPFIPRSNILKHPRLSHVLLFFPFLEHHVRPLFFLIRCSLFRRSSVPKLLPSLFQYSQTYPSCSLDLSNVGSVFFGFWLIYPRKSMHFCGEIIFSLLIYYSFLWIKESSLLRNFRNVDCSEFTLQGKFYWFLIKRNSK